MGKQLIFVVETSPKCKSDWIYIKNTIEYFYQYDPAHTKFTPVYMNGKGNYTKQAKKIDALKSQYAAASNNNASHVFFCFDCDDYDTNQEDTCFLENAQRYCCDHKHDLIWFCKDIEQVYWGERITNTQKKAKAATFQSSKMITQVNKKNLICSTYKTHTSNILSILDQYLYRKESS